MTAAQVAALPLDHLALLLDDVAALKADAKRLGDLLHDALHARHGAPAAAALRANKLCNLVWNTYEEIVDACDSAWHFLTNDPDRIRSIGTREWARVSL
jgi:hypothetical protein